MHFYKFVATLGLVAVLGASAPAYAMDENAARLHFERATEAFTKGKYDDAVREYLLAYRASGDGTLLFNVGQSHRLAGHYSAALQYYRMYLQNSPDASDRKEVEKQIREMEKKLNKEASPSLPPPRPVEPPRPVTPVGPPEPPPAPMPTVTAPPPPDTVLSPSPEPTPTPTPATSDMSPYRARAKVIGGAVTLGIGGAMAITGIVFGALAQQKGDELTRDNRNGLPFDPSKQSAGQTDQILEGVFIGVGAAAVVAGAVVLGIGIKEQRAARFAVVPSVNSTGAGASVSFRY